MAIADSEGCILFIAFSDPHPIIDNNQIKLDKMLSLAKLVE